MKYKARINGDVIFALAEWDANAFDGNPSLTVQSADFNIVKTTFETIEKIEIFVSENPVGTYTVYDSFSDIQYLGRRYVEADNIFADCMRVTLKKTSLVEQVERLDKQINPVIDIDGMTTEQYRDYLLADISKQGEAEIFAGTAVTLSAGNVEQFTYNLQDQSNIKTASMLAMNLEDVTLQIPYNEHNGICSLYSALDILIIYFALELFATQVKTRVNALKAYIKTVQTKEELLTITYDTPLAGEYEEHYERIVAQSVVLLDDMKKKYIKQFVGDEGAE